MWEKYYCRVKLRGFLPGEGDKASKFKLVQGPNFSVVGRGSLSLSERPSPLRMKAYTLSFILLTNDQSVTCSLPLYMYR